MKLKDVDVEQLNPWIVGTGVALWQSELDFNAGW
jgi:hypothetical protein